MSDTFTVQILSPQSVVWEGQVIALESENVEGEFSILPDHARFMTIIGKVPILAVLPNEKVETFSFPQAVLFFADNVAKIYTQPELVSTEN